MKRLLALVLALLLVLSVTAYAAETDPTPGEMVQDAQDDTQSEPQENDTGDEEDPEEFVPLEGYLETEKHVTYFSGSGDMAYPEGRLTRAEASSMIYSLLKEKPQAAALHFTDVKTGAWYQPKVDALAELGVITGKGEGKFAPTANITRAEFVTILSKFFPMEEGETSFKDLKPGSWYYPYMINAIAKGWVNGYEDNTVRPGNNITRAEAVAVINNVLGRSADKNRIDLYSVGKVMQFLDLSYSHWSYYHIMEASLSHNYERSGGKELWSNLTVPQTVRAPGYYLYKGDLYKVDSTRHWARSVTDGVLKFDKNGRYTTGNTELDGMLKKIVLAQTVEGDTLEENWKRLFKYAAGSDFSYLNRGYLADGQTGWEVDKALQMLRTHKGNCYNYASVTTFLARWMGYQATPLSGYVYTPQNGAYAKHGWTQINIGGVNYLADPELQYVFGKRVGASWDLYMKRYSTVVPKYKTKGVVLK